MSDIADIARGDRVGTFGRPASSLEPYRRAGMRLHEGGYYIRLSVYDRPGAFAAIAARMAADRNFAGIDRPAAPGASLDGARTSGAGSAAAGDPDHL